MHQIHVRLSYLGLFRLISAYSLSQNTIKPAEISQNHPSEQSEYLCVAVCYPNARQKKKSISHSLQYKRGYSVVSDLQTSLVLEPIEVVCVSCLGM